MVHGHLVHRPSVAESVGEMTKLMSPLQATSTALALWSSTGPWWLNLHWLCALWPSLVARTNPGSACWVHHDLLWCWKYLPFMWHYNTYLSDDIIVMATVVRRWYVFLSMRISYNEFSFQNALLWCRMCKHCIIIIATGGSTSWNACINHRIEDQLTFDMLVMDMDLWHVLKCNI